MKIIHFNDFEHYSGAETAIKMLRESHEKSGIKTFLFTRKEIGNKFTPKIIKKIRCNGILNKIKPDLIHMHNTIDIGLIPAEIALEKNIPIIWTLHDYRGICPNTLFLKANNTVCIDKNCAACDISKMVVYYNYKKFQSILRQSRCVVASNYVKKRYSEIIKAKRIYWDADSNLLKLKIKDSSKSRSILFAGRRDYEKGVSYAIMAVKRLIKKYPNIKLIFAGETRDENTKQLAKIYKIEQNIIDFGYLPREKYLNLLNGVNCVICPSIWEEPFNLSLLEAMSAGKPVIATKVGGQTEVLGKTGILIEPKSSGDIANAINLLFSDSKMHKKLSLKARERAKTFKNCGEEYKKVYEEAIKNKNN